jgi:hypothetical protein
MTDDTATLTANASGPCGTPASGPSTAFRGVGANCTWTLGSGHGAVGATIGDGTGNFVATFTCPPGKAEVDLLVVDCTDGPLPDGGFCPAEYTHGTTVVVCGHPPPCSEPGEDGVEASPNTSTGHCPLENGAPYVNSGVADAEGNFCCVPRHP